MDTILDAAEALLRRDPAPALRLYDLLERLRAEGPDPGLDAGRLHALLSSRPDRFRVLELWRGPLRGLAAAAEAGPGAARDGTWVAAVPDPVPPRVGGRTDVLFRLRESVRWLAGRVDARSPRSVLRWCRLALAEEEVRDAVRRAG